jgi:hypothetical protein
MNFKNLHFEGARNLIFIEKKPFNGFYTKPGGLDSQELIFQTVQNFSAVETYFLKLSRIS